MRPEVFASPPPDRRKSAMSVNVLYTTQATATGGRDGEAATKDGSFKVKLSTPKELGGAGGTGNNPEQLFASGWSACFIGAMKFVGGQKKQPIPASTTVTATIGIGPRSEGGFGPHRRARYQPARGWTRPRPRRWLRRRKRSARIPTRRGAMSRRSTTWSERPPTGCVRTGRPILCRPVCFSGFSNDRPRQ